MELRLWFVFVLLRPMCSVGGNVKHAVAVGNSMVVSQKLKQNQQFYF